MTMTYQYEQVPADIIVRVSGGVVQEVELPKGFQGRVVIIDYDNGDGEAEECDRDESGELCSIGIYPQEDDES